MQGGCRNPVCNFAHGKMPEETNKALLCLSIQLHATAPDVRLYDQRQLRCCALSAGITNQQQCLPPQYAAMPVFGAQPPQLLNSSWLTPAPAQPGAGSSRCRFQETTHLSCDFMYSELLRF
jgi:hypothetical protein